MRCPFCNYEETKVVDSRPADQGNMIRRRRECFECAKRFTTFEKIESIPLMVIKKDRSLEPFDREKLINGLLKACEKRPVSIDQIEALVDNIESQIRNTLKREVESQEIGEMLMDALKDLDEIAYVRFASVYRQFKDVNTFINELKKLLKENRESK